MNYPEAFKNLIEAFKLLPGIGEKTATRLALFTYYEKDNKVINDLSKSLKELKEKITICPICNTMMEEKCPYCDNEERNHKVIMVVESIKDLLLIEKTNYDGLYHILEGLIDVSRGIEPNDISIDKLAKRVDNIDELIIALDGTLNGELTSSYLKEIFKDKEVKVTRIAYGIPVGIDLSFADEKTLKKALDNRAEME